jgi:drug/metabolite transporter (DMT)-like permease
MAAPLNAEDSLGAATSEVPMDALEGAAPIAISKASPVKVAGAYLACALIWGTTWYAIRVCIGPGGYPTYAAAAWRFTLSSTVLAVIWLAIRKKIKRPSFVEFKWISVSGLLSGVAYGLLYASEEHISGGLAAVISATSPLMAALLAMRMKLESPRKATIIGSLVAIAGVAFVFHDRMQISVAQASAVGILLFNSMLNSSSNALMKQHGHHVVALASNTIFFASAALLLWSISLFTHGNALPLPLPLVPTLALLYLTVFGTLIAFASFFYLLKHTRLSTAMTLSFVTPMIALFIDAFFEKHNVLTPETYLGISVVLIGVIISVVKKSEAPSV